MGGQQRAEKSIVGDSGATGSTALPSEPASTLGTRTLQAGADNSGGPAQPAVYSETRSNGSAPSHGSESSASKSFARKNIFDMQVAAKEEPVLWSVEERKLYLTTLHIVSLPGEEPILSFLSDAIAAAPLPAPWVMRRDPENRVFFANQPAEVVSWFHPLEPSLRELAGAFRVCLTLHSALRRSCVQSLHDTWEQEARGEFAKWYSVKHESGRACYCHRETGEAMWEHPAEVILPAHYLKLMAIEWLLNDEYYNSLVEGHASAAVDDALSGTDPTSSRSTARQTARRWASFESPLPTSNREAAAESTLLPPTKSSASQLSPPGGGYPGRKAPRGTGAVELHQVRRDLEQQLRQVMSSQRALQEELSSAESELKAARESDQGNRLRILQAESELAQERLRTEQARSELQLGKAPQPPKASTEADRWVMLESSELRLQQELALVGAERERLAQGQAAAAEAQRRAERKERDGAEEVERRWREEQQELELRQEGLQEERQVLAAERKRLAAREEAMAQATSKAASLGAARAEAEMKATQDANRQLREMATKAEEELAEERRLIRLERERLQGRGAEGDASAAPDSQQVRESAEAKLEAVEKVLRQREEALQDQLGEAAKLQAQLRRERAGRVGLGGANAELAARQKLLEEQLHEALAAKAALEGELLKARPGTLALGERPLSSKSRAANAAEEPAATAAGAAEPSESAAAAPVEAPRAPELKDSTADNLLGASLPELLEEEAAVQAPAPAPPQSPISALAATPAAAPEAAPECQAPQEPSIGEALESALEKALLCSPEKAVEPEEMPAESPMKAFQPEEVRAVLPEKAVEPEEVQAPAPEKAVEPEDAREPTPETREPTPEKAAELDELQALMPEKAVEPEEVQAPLPEKAVEPEEAREPTPETREPTPEKAAEPGEVQALMPEKAVEPEEVQAPLPEKAVEPEEVQAPSPEKAVEPRELQEPSPIKAVEPQELQEPSPKKAVEPQEAQEPSPRKAVEPQELQEPSCKKVDEPEEVDKLSPEKEVVVDEEATRPTTSGSREACYEPEPESRVDSADPVKKAKEEAVRQARDTLKERADRAEDEVLLERRRVQQAQQNCNELASGRDRAMATLQDAQRAKADLQARLAALERALREREAQAEREAGELALAASGEASPTHPSHSSSSSPKASSSEQREEASPEAQPTPEVALELEEPPPALPAKEECLPVAEEAAEPPARKALEVSPEAAAPAVEDAAPREKPAEVAQEVVARREAQEAAKGVSALAYSAAARRLSEADREVPLAIPRTEEEFAEAEMERESAVGRRNEVERMNDTLKDKIAETEEALRRTWQQWKTEERVSTAMSQMKEQRQIGEHTREECNKLSMSMVSFLESAQQASGECSEIEKRLSVAEELLKERQAAAAEESERRRTELQKELAEERAQVAELESTRAGLDAKNQKLEEQLREVAAMQAELVEELRRKEEDLALQTALPADLGARRSSYSPSASPREEASEAVSGDSSQQPKSQKAVHSDRLARKHRSSNSTAEPVAVTSSMTVKNVDYHQLSANPALLGSFTEAMKQTIASSAGLGVLPEHVELSFSAGSVVVQARITPPRGVSTSAVTSELKAAALSEAVASTVANLEGIQEVATGPISVAEVRVVTPEPSPRIHKASRILGDARAQREREGRKARKALEDAIVLASRIQLLRAEGARTQKRIRQTQEKAEVLASAATSKQLHALPSGYLALAEQPSASAAPSRALRISDAAETTPSKGLRQSIAETSDGGTRAAAQELLQAMGCEVSEASCGELADSVELSFALAVRSKITASKDNVRRLNAALKAEVAQLQSEMQRALQKAASLAAAKA